MPHKKPRDYQTRSILYSHYYRNLHTEWKVNSHVEQSPEPVHSPSAVLRLPNELLIDILLSSDINNPHHFLSLARVCQRFHGLISDQRFQQAFAANWFARNNVGDTIEFIVRYAKRNPSWVSFGPRLVKNRNQTHKDMGSLSCALPWTEDKMRQLRVKLEGARLGPLPEDLSMMTKTARKKWRRYYEAPATQAWLMHGPQKESSKHKHKWGVEDVMLGYWLNEVHDWMTKYDKEQWPLWPRTPFPGDRRGMNAKQKGFFNALISSSSHYVRRFDANLDLQLLCRERKAFFQYWESQASPIGLK
ncbi:hypothetical protein BJ508DRAFT_304910 [Ascobolus immersus RN42]|uniref:F-box domain-containing protein n=1 Tax=Ascobolus immersus RN42 TaxID=1160509 RepID=A0A3N4IG66_ASCIM|nr:hypothetical protein BJ508DRAFT_304910 [Ascobolus immersus RN42]